jgi:phenylpropionate dioxygenase-like ring-hydroxylating dioxygenase large terminal subunit
MIFQILFLLFISTSAFLPPHQFNIPRKTELYGKKYNMADDIHIDTFEQSWYVIGKPDDFKTDVPNKVSIWNKNYAVWRKSNNEYVGLDNVCPHRGASLSGGVVCNNHIVCPYHAYEFNSTGKLTKIPGINFNPSPLHNIAPFIVAEHNI